MTAQRGVREGGKGIRYPYIDAAKAIALYFVIVGHAVYAKSLFFSFIFAFHMPAFFFFAGYCTERKEELFSRYCIRKAKSLLIPYVIFSLIGLLIMAVFPDEWLVRTSVQDYLVRYLYIAQPYALGSIWFLVCLFFSSIGCFCVLRIWSGQKVWTLLPVAIGFSILGAYLYKVTSFKLFGRLPMKTDSALTAVSFMLFGYILKKAGRFEKWNRGVLYAGAAVLPAVVWLFGCRLNGYVNLCDCVYDHYRYYIIASLAGCLWVLIIGRLLQRVRFLQWLGRNSLPIFAIHSFLLWAVISGYDAIVQSKMTNLPDGAMPLLLSLVTYLLCVPFAMLYNLIRAKIKTWITARSRKLPS